MGSSFPIIHSFVGAWLSLVERSVRDREVGGSNPLAPTISFKNTVAIIWRPYLFAAPFLAVKLLFRTADCRLATGD